MRRGNQEPTFKTRIVYAHTDGPEVVEWFESIGHAFYPCQAMEMDVFCARDDAGDFAYRTICISKPRQNGKSYSQLRGREVSRRGNESVLLGAPFAHDAQDVQGSAGDI